MISFIGAQFAVIRPGRQAPRRFATAGAAFVGLLLALFLAPHLHAADLDCDGIPDEFENELLQRFDPVIKRNDFDDRAKEYLGVPASASWLAGHTDLGYETNRFQGTVFVPVVMDLTPESLLIYSITDRAVASTLRLNYREPDARWGITTTDPTHWQDAIDRNRGVYGRVWQPWTNTHPNLYSVQYYLLLTWNEPPCLDDFPGIGEKYRHDADLLCLDYCVDTSLPGGPTIVHAIYFNHSRQIFVTRDALRFENGHPLAFLEVHANEPWPNPGDSGVGGWPQMDGVAFGELDCSPLDQGCCEGSHSGEGNVYRTRNIPNLGEAPWANLPEQRAYLPLGDLDCQVFLQYPGQLGFRGDSPRGPAFQPKMWRREVQGPWAAAGDYATNDVLKPNLEAMQLNTACRWVFVATNLTNIAIFKCYDFLPVCDVRAGSTNEQRGLPSKPFVTVAQGTQKVATYGVLRVATGTYPETMEISKPMLIEATNGMVTIGR